MYTIASLTVVADALCSATPPCLDVELLRGDAESCGPLGPLSPQPLSPNILTICRAGQQRPSSAEGHDYETSREGTPGLWACRSLPDLRYSFGNMCWVRTSPAAGTSTAGSSCSGTALAAPGTADVSWVQQQPQEQPQEEPKQHRPSSVDDDDNTLDSTSPGPDHG